MTVSIDGLGEAEGPDGLPKGKIYLFLCGGAETLIQLSKQTGNYRTALGCKLFRLPITTIAMIFGAEKLLLTFLRSK